jgi:hypothetical protein
MMPTIEEIEAMRDRLLAYGPIDIFKTSAAMLNQIGKCLRDSQTWWVAIEDPSDTNEIAMSWNADDANDGEAARTEANQWINDQPHPGNFHLAKVHTTPPPADEDVMVTDKMVHAACRAYEKARISRCGFSGTPSTDGMRAAINEAMRQSGEAK